MKNLLLSIAVLFFISCNNESEIINNSRLNHPVVEYMPHHEFLVDNSYSDSIESSVHYEYWSDLIEKINNTEVYKEIGTDDNEEFIGDITDIKLDKDKNIFLLDSKTFTIKVYDSEGNYITKYSGNEGIGPPDLSMPYTLYVKDSLVNVADARYQLKFLEFSNNELTFSHANVLEKLMPSAICGFNDEIYLGGLRDDYNTEDILDYKIIHAFTLDDTRFKRSIGDIYQSPRMATNLEAVSGPKKLECFPNSDIITTSVEKFGYVYGYKTSGEISWVHKIRDFKEPIFLEKIKDGKTFGFSFEIDGDQIINHVNINDYLLIHTRSYGTARSDDKKAFNTYVITPENGKLVFKYTTDNAILDLKDNTLIQTIDNRNASFQIKKL